MDAKGQLYNIAGIKTKIIYNRFEMFRSFETFSDEFHSEINLQIIVKSSKKILKPSGFLQINKEVKWVSISEGIYVRSIYFCAENTEEIICRADVNYKWSQAEITYLKNNQKAERLVLGYLFEVIFRNCMIFNQGVVIHASALTYRGKGIIFTAPSQTGKSTQAKLWAKYTGAEILNDDRPALRLNYCQPRVYGTPWSGENSLFSNKSADLKAIVLLQQAKENKLRPLPISIAAIHILPRCFLPYYDGVSMDQCLKTMAEILGAVPVYRLECKPDKDAVELVLNSLI